MPAAHQAGLDRAGLGVEAGVQEGGVGLACPRADISTCLHERAAQLKARELARDRAADDAGADDDDVALR